MDVEFRPLAILTPDQEALLTEEVKPIPSNIPSNISVLRYKYLDA